MLAVDSTAGSPRLPAQQPRPSKEQLEMGKVFVGGLSRETTTQGLRSYFERFGEISDCIVMKDRSTGAPRGFGFVTYASQVIADRVVLHRHVIDGKEVEAKPAVPRDSDALAASPRRCRALPAALRHRRPSRRLSRPPLRPRGRRRQASSTRRARYSSAAFRTTRASRTSSATSATLARWSIA